MRGQRKGQATAARSKIERFKRGGGVGRKRIKEVPGALGQQFGFGPWNQDLGIDQDFQAAERSGPNDMLKRFTFAATFHKLADRFQFGWSQRALEIEVELQARHTQRISEEQFALEAGRVDPFAAEKLGAALNDFQNGHN